MADTDTLDETRSARLQVASLPPGDSGRGLARVPAKVMSSLGLTEGDVIEIEGKRVTAARAIRPYNEDEKLDIIRLDGLQRANAEIGSGDFVEVRRAESKAAQRVVRIGLKALDKNRAVVVAGPLNKTGAALTRFVPRAVTRKIAGMIKY